MAPDRLLWENPSCCRPLVHVNGMRRNGERGRNSGSKRTGTRWTGFPAPIHPIHPTGLRDFDRHEPLLEPAKDAGYRSIPKLA